MDTVSRFVSKLTYPFCMLTVTDFFSGFVSKLIYLSCMLTAMETIRIQANLSRLHAKCNGHRIQANLYPSQWTACNIPPAVQQIHIPPACRFISKLIYPSYMLTATDTVSRFVSKITYPPSVNRARISPGILRDSLSLRAVVTEHLNNISK
ncbi:hypothetical protein CDAR_468071 [Caerostris darwini]|uniref:Uncharacterized protein n=1 Tax=Caerostris darwini TaxID=1538125 RepID=A0AAV4WXN6_9ARAC|nr:hypothetical protein CDAR_468071 [Caerostris darwini]